MNFFLVLIQLCYKKVDTLLKEMTSAFDPKQNLVFKRLMHTSG